MCGQGRKTLTLRDRAVAYADTLADLGYIWKRLDEDTSKYGKVALDLETTGLDPHTDRILLVQLCTDNDCYVIPARTPYGNTGFGNQKQWDESIAVIFKRISYLGYIAHNGKFEYQFVKTHYGIELQHIFDTMLAESVLGAGYFRPVDLGATIERRLGIKLDKATQKSFIDLDPDTFEATPEQIEYAVNDVMYMHALMQVQTARSVQKELQNVLQLEFDAMPVFADMELTGLYLNLNRHAEVLARYESDSRTYGELAVSLLDPHWQAFAAKVQAHNKEEYDKYVQHIAERRKSKANPDGDLVPGSDELKALYKERDKWKPKAISTIRLGSRMEVLSALLQLGIEMPNLKKETVKAFANRHDALTAFAKWRTAEKVVSTYGWSLRDRVHPKTHRVHTTYNQIVSTGRTSSRKPNHQNATPDIRATYEAEEGNMLVGADASNMELRIAAARYHDPAMIQAFEQGWDLHRMTAAAAWPELYSDWTQVPKDSAPKSHRSLGKTGNFLSIYGGTAEAAVYRGVFPDVATGVRVQTAIQKLYPKMWQGIWAEGPKALKRLYATTNMGRKRFFRPLGPEPDRRKDNDAWKLWRKRKRSIMRQAMNHGIQGTGADIMKLAGILIRQRLRKEGLGYVQAVVMVHDEWVYESKEADAQRVAEIVLDGMEQAAWHYVPNLVIPGEVHVSKQWEK
jgi:DNA polymerase-1